MLIILVPYFCRWASFLLGVIDNAFLSIVTWALSIMDYINSCYFWDQSLCFMLYDIIHILISSIMLRIDDCIPLLLRSFVNL